jgi:glycosyltransferase involved in cell wall biosynthesis
VPGSTNGHKPKLLFLAPGSWVHGRRALKAALMAGFETVFVDSHDPGMQGTKSYRFIKLPRSAYSLYKRVLPRTAATQIKDRFLSWWFKKLWERVSPDVVHVCWIDYRAAFCSRAGMRPLILSCWGSDINFQIEQEVDVEWRAFVTEALSGASLTIVDAPGMAARCDMLTGRHVPSEMLHLGVDTDRFRSGLLTERREMRAKLDISDDAVLLSSMRAMSGLYNHELILEAFAQSISKLRKPTYLLFKSFNSHAAYFETLHRRAQELGVTDRVRFVEEIPDADLTALYAATDIVINFPQRDSFPVTLLEAAACERPVICSDLETYTGVVPDDNITWVPANDCVELAAAITQRTNGYEYREGSFPTVRDAVVECFSEMRYQQRLAAIYRSLVS